LPRKNIWIQQEQLEEIHRRLGPGVNLSGVVRLAVGGFLLAASGPREYTLIKDLEILGRLEDLLDEAETATSSKARAAAEAAAGG
jgi:hypothetical protein